MWTVTGNSSYVVYGGEFPKVNGVPQQGLVRYAVRSLAPNKQGPRLSGASLAPTLSTSTPGAVKLTWPGNCDRDDSTLTYQVFRNNTSTKVFQADQTARFWETKPMRFTDTGLTPGSTVQYLVRTLDPSGNLASSTWVSATVAGTQSLGTYGTKVRADGATKYWRLNEPSGARPSATGRAPTPPPPAPA